MDTKKKTDLFRFATLRAPQLISKERRKLGFVENQNISETHFFVNLDLTDNLDILRLAIQARITLFEPFKTVEEIKAINPEFWDFSLWLAENRNAIERTEIDGIINGVLLTDETVIDLWDNIYFDILTEENPYVRQACAQMLIADNFIRNYQFYSPNLVPEEAENEAKLIKRLANGKLVIHPAITRKKVPATAGSRKNHLPAPKQEQKLKAQIAELQLDVLRNIEKDLILLKAIYKAAYKDEFEKAKGVYQATVKPIIARYITLNPQIKNDPNIENLLPDDLIESFEFTFDGELSDAITAGNVSGETKDFIKSNNLEDSDIDDALNLIDSKKKVLKGTAANIIQKRVTEVIVKGVNIKANTMDAKEFAISFEQVNGINQYLLYFSMDAGYKGAYFSEGSFSLQIGDQHVALNFENPCLNAVKDNSIFIRITNVPITLDPCTMYLFTATLTLNDESVYFIEKKGNSNQLLASGRAYRVNVGDDDVVIYGVNRIGVIDYRKVEQELCCYIPGEVSHIENIMAKEYKDRTTRSLSRIEQTFESSSEREVESSTDTTSTSRFELSSEVAKIIEKERSIDLGFEASANGGPDAYKWHVGATGDFSFGQSTSNSSTIAQTKAQELVQRALERVVQKVSSTRTSKMMREFEDSSSHGFDNRKGTSHITGIYRWVDKIYKNRIINYGKRLMYEFMIPEPARWYKEAIIVEAEESEGANGRGNSETELVKPIHPKDNNIHSADSITRDNFAQLGALYGVELTAPANQFSNLNHTFSQAEGTSDNTFNYPDYAAVQLTPDYLCVQIKGTIQGAFKSKSKTYASLNIGMGPKTYSIPSFGDGEANFSLPFDYAGLSISTSVKFTMTTHKIKNITVAAQIICELSLEKFKLWQQNSYASIMEAYNQQLAAYNDADAAAKAEAAALEAAAKEESEAKGSNSRFNDQIINTELKRLCIEMLTSPFGREQGKDFYLPGECKVPKMAQSKALDEYASQVKFFEQAFDWSILSEMFYPYYWAKKCDWKALFQSQESSDLGFQAFLQSGMARVMVPVREGFEDAVVFYMETGRIWNGSGLVVDTDDELYLSIVDEMTEIKGFIDGDEWETIVPSDLTIIQAKSAFLEDEGLPCCEENDDLPVNMKFQGTSAVMTAKDETEETEDPVTPE